MFTRNGKKYRIMRHKRGYFYIEYEHKLLFISKWKPFVSTILYSTGMEEKTMWFLTADNAIDYLQTALWNEVDTYEVI